MEPTTIVRSSAATRWLEALPLGNGHIGAMAWGDPLSARFSLNDSTLWSGSPDSSRRRLTGRQEAAEAIDRARSLLQSGRGAEADRALSDLGATWCQAYQPLGELRVDRVGTERDQPLPGGPEREEIGPAHRILDMLDHVHTVRSADGEHRSFVSAADDVLVHAMPLSRSETLQIGFTSELVEESREAGEDALDLVLRAASDCPPAHAPGSPTVQWDEDGPARAAVSVRWRREGPRALLVVAVATTWQGFGQMPDRSLEESREAARQQARTAIAQSEQDLFARHRERVRPVAGAVQLDLEGTERSHLLGDLFAYGRYLLQASSRPGMPPANLQGIWNAELTPPWSSNFTTNINLEMAHWASGVAHVPDAVLALEEYVDALRRSGEDTARRLYGARGWSAHHNSDPWGYSEPVAGPAVWATWPMAGLWLETDLADLRRFEGLSPRDRAATDFPRLREVSAFALDLLCSWPGSSELVTFPSTSPENRYLDADGEPVAASAGTAMDRWLVRRAFTRLIEAADLLGRSEDSVVVEAREALGRIAPPRIGGDGRILEWHEELPESEVHHRHISHLAFAYPGTEEVDERLARAIRRSLEIRSDEASGWSLAWKISQWARLRDSHRVERLLDLCLRDAEDADGSEHSGLYPNLFSAHPPFQIDGNIGIVSAISECLLQSHRGEIEILPALPETMSSGSIRGLRARPGVSVDICWERGVPTALSLTALGPGAARTTTVRWGEHTADVDLNAESSVDVDITALTADRTRSTS